MNENKLQAITDELTDDVLDHVAGGFCGFFIQQQDVTLNKSKAANKAADAMDAYIRG